MFQVKLEQEYSIQLKRSRIILEGSILNTPHDFDFHSLQNQF